MTAGLDRLLDIGGDAVLRFGKELVLLDGAFGTRVVGVGLLPRPMPTKSAA